MLTKEQFQLSFREMQDDGGHSYDPWTVEMVWRDYQSGSDRGTKVQAAIMDWHNKHHMLST